VDGGKGSIPCEVRSAGLEKDGTGLHIAEDVSSRMMSTLLPTDVFLLVNGRCSHVSTIEDSVMDVEPSSRNKSERNVILWRGWLVACWL